MTEITIPDGLADRIDSRVERTDFESADAYAAFVLSEVVTRVERAADGDTGSAASRDGVQDRLQSLGYLEE
ncbi:MAG: hypothetical protein ACOCZD_02555 [Haloferacaceae archaeon]